MITPTPTQIKTEMETGPLSAYFTTHANDTDADNQECADKLNEIGASNETLPRGLVPASEVAAALVSGDQATLTPNKQNQIITLLSAGEVDINATNVQTLFDVLFDGTVTRTNLTALQTRSVSRAKKLDWTTITIGEIHNARIS